MGGSEGVIVYSWLTRSPRCLRRSDGRDER
jgi:hypothetical protein